MAEQQIGVINEFFAHISVAGVELSDTMRVGDTIHIKGHTTDSEQAVDSMQIEHEQVQEAQGRSGRGDQGEGPRASRRPGLQGHLGAATPLPLRPFPVQADSVLYLFGGQPFQDLVRRLPATLATRYRDPRQQHGARREDGRRPGDAA